MVVTVTWGFMWFVAGYNGFEFPPLLHAAMAAVAAANGYDFFQGLQIQKLKAQTDNLKAQIELGKLGG